MKRGGIPIRVQLIIVTILLVIIPVSIVGTVLYMKVSQEMDGYIVETLREQAKLVDGIIEREYENLSTESDEATFYCRYLFGKRLSAEVKPETRLQVAKSGGGSAPTIPEVEVNGKFAGGSLPMLRNTGEFLGVEISLYYFNSGGGVMIFGEGARRTGANRVTSSGVIDAGSRIFRELKDNNRWVGVEEADGQKYMTQYVTAKDFREGGSLVLRVRTSVDEYQARVTDFLSEITVGEQGYIFVLNMNGEYVLSENRNRDGENIMGATDEEGRHFIREMISKAPDLEEDRSGVLRYPWRNSEEEPLKEKIAVYRHFEAWDWVWGVSAVRDDFAGGIAAVRMVTIVIAVVFAGLAILAAFVVGTAFSKPISHIERVMARVAEGDFTEEVALRSSVRELKRLSENFDEKLLVSMRKMIGQIKYVTDYSHETGEKISNQVEGTLVFTNQMTQQLVQMKGQIHGLDGQINEASSAVEQIQATISNVAKQIDQQSSAVSETSASIEEMNSSIQSVAKIAEEKQEATSTLLEITGEGGEKVRSTNEIIQNIGVSINDMMDMITIINKVAAQTNLLAMNAAIEAAHAGDAGRGFAVVAEEIRNLSSSTSDSAKKISNRLKEIVGRIQEATEMSEATGTAFQKIEEEVKEFVNAFQEIASSTAELSTGSEEMLNAVNSLQNVAQEIQDGSEEMRGGSQDINEALQSLKEFSGNTVGSLKDLEEKTTNVNYAQGNMTDLVIGNSDNAEKLAQEISRFKISTGEQTGTEELSFSDLVRFSVGALLLQEWIVNVRNVLNQENVEREIPRLEKGRLQKWIDEHGKPYFGDEETFQEFLRAYEQLVELSDEMSRLRAEGESEKVESVYNRMVEQMKKAKSSLHSLRYTLSEKLEQNSADGVSGRTEGKDDPDEETGLETVEEDER